jgi:predicted carbohydrate-binding protein with CBM5 and CBM33 domain
MISEYKYKIISKVIQNLVTWCSENNDKKNQMICVYFQGVLNDYKKIKNTSFKLQATRSPQLESRIKKC